MRYTRKKRKIRYRQKSGTLSIDQTQPVISEIPPGIGQQTSIPPIIGQQTPNLTIPIGHPQYVLPIQGIGSHVRTYTQYQINEILHLLVKCGLNVAESTSCINTIHLVEPYINADFFIKYLSIIHNKPIETRKSFVFGFMTRLTDFLNGISKFIEQKYIRDPYEYTNYDYDEDDAYEDDEYEDDYEEY